MVERMWQMYKNVARLEALEKITNTTVDLCKMKCVTWLRLWYRLMNKICCRNKSRLIEKTNAQQWTATVNDGN